MKWPDISCYLVKLQMPWRHHLLDMNQIERQVSADIPKGKVGMLSVSEQNSRLCAPSKTYIGGTRCGCVTLKVNEAYTFLNAF